MVHLVTFARDGAARLGALEGGTVFDLHALDGSLPADMLGLIQAGAAALEAARGAVAAGRRRLRAGEGAALAASGQGFPAAAVRLLAPIPHPAKNIVCLGRNYVAHARERGSPEDAPAVVQGQVPGHLLPPGAGHRHGGGLPETPGRGHQHAGEWRSSAGFPTIVAVLSRGMTLSPGDIIATGTPEGVGAANGRFLKAGDLLEAEVEGIGVLRNRVARV